MVKAIWSFMSEGIKPNVSSGKAIDKTQKKKVSRRNKLLYPIHIFNIQVTTLHKNKNEKITLKATTVLVITCNQSKMFSS